MELALQIALVLLAATLVRSAFGFGEALVAVPLLAFILPVEVAAPVAVLASITVAAIALAQDWRQVHFRSAVWLVVSTLPGIPLGLLVLKSVPAPLVKGGLALAIVVFSLYALAGPGHSQLQDDRWAWVFGFIAGVLGGAYGMNGPPLAIYGSLRGWSPGQFRATLQGYFLPASMLGMAGYGLAGLWTRRVSVYFLWSLPAILLGTWAGRAINRRLDARRFLLYVHAGLTLIGLTLLWQAMGY